MRRACRRCGCMLRANERENAWRMLCDAEHLSKYEYLRIVRAVYVKLYGLCACVPRRARARSGCHLGVALVSPRSPRARDRPVDFSLCL